jgi:type IV pilus assembly protein PilY1
MTWYNLYIFGDSQGGINAMQQASMYGAFNDYDTNSWPYGSTGYPSAADSRDATLPASPCDPLAPPMASGCEEWDKNHDGLPDTYYEASAGGRLEQSLIEAITDILKNASSGTAVSVLATTGEGEGAVYQAYFYPEKLENFVARKWVGYLHSIFVDKYGNLREDTNGNDAVDMNIDLILEMSYDATLGTRVNKFIDADGDGEKDSASPSAVTDLEGITPVWQGGEMLWSRDPDTRTIYTTTDGYTDLEFTTTIPANVTELEPYLRAADSTEAANIINWVRGDDLPAVVDAGHPNGYRERSLTINSQTHVWKLGDIIYSTPTTVGRPMENFDLLYHDTDFTNFRIAHKNRRRVVYVGANDGMLHAFNAGCYEEATHKFWPAPGLTGGCAPGGVPLGGELWAFIPRSLLPHLKWNTDPDYTHVYYVDAKPKVADAKIFNADATVHLGGWGTILIGSFRYGGKDISWSHTDSTSGITTDYNASPEYFALDITDPDNPRLLWTFSHPDMGLSMSYPALAKVGTKWYAIFGSGATDYDTQSNLTAFQDAGIFVIDLTSGINGVIDTWTLNDNYWIIQDASPSADAFLAEPVTVDVNLDSNADVIYVGENFQQGGGSWNTRMRRLTTDKGHQTDPGQWTLSTLADIDDIAGTNDKIKVITSAPSMALDNRYNFWVYFGTGRFQGSLDKNHVDSGAFYAIKDPCWEGDPSYCTGIPSLLNVTNAEVNSDLSSTGASGCSNPGSWVDLLQASYACDGWAMYFHNMTLGQDFTGAALAHQGERLVSNPIVIGGLVIFATYIPGVDECSYYGESNVYAVYYKTGTGYKEYVFKEQKESGDTTQDYERVKRLGEGMPSSISAQVTDSGSTKGYAQQSTGSILGVEALTPISMKSGILQWRNEKLR